MKNHALHICVHKVPIYLFGHTILIKDIEQILGSKVEQVILVPTICVPKVPLFVLGPTIIILLNILEEILRARMQ